jgi:hypothetical protein
MNGLEGNTVLMTGQGHLQRGGYADIAALSWNSKQAERILKGKVTSDLVGREVNDINRQVIDQWLDVRSKQINGSPVNLLHWGNADFRLGYWYASTFMAMDGVTPLLMPLLDDRVCSFLTATVPEWRVYETMNFRSIRTMAPQLAQLPLYNDRWRFEQGGPIEGFPGYDLRAPLPKVTDAKTKDGITYDESPRRFDPLQQYICQAVLDSMIWKEIRRNLGHELILQIESQAAGRGNTQYWSCLGNRRGPYQQVLLRVFLVAMLYSCQWLKPSRILDPGLRT